MVVLVKGYNMHICAQFRNSDGNTNFRYEIPINLIENSSLDSTIRFYSLLIRYLIPALVLGKNLRVLKVKYKG